MWSSSIPFSAILGHDIFGAKKTKLHSGAMNTGLILKSKEKYCNL